MRHSFPSSKEPPTAPALSPIVHDSSADPDLEAAATPDAPLRPRVFSFYGSSSGPSTSLVLRLLGGSENLLAPWPAVRPSRSHCGPLWLPIVFAAVSLFFFLIATILQYHPGGSCGGVLIVLFYTLSAALQATVIIMRHPVCFYAEGECVCANLWMMIVGVLAQLLFFTSAIVGHVGMANGNPAAVGPAATMYLFAFWLYWCYQLAHSIFLAVDTTRISSSDKVGLYILMGIGFGLNLIAFATIFGQPTIAGACEAGYIIIVAVTAFMQP